MTNRFMHGWTPPCQSHQFCILLGAWRCFSTLRPPACHYIYPCSLLSANTFTLLVLLSNKRGGMSWGPLPFLKQTSMNSPHWVVTPPPTPKLPHKSIHPPTAWLLLHSAGQQCCGLSLLGFIHSSRPQLRGSLTRVCLTQEVPHWYFCPVWILCERRRHF